MTEHDAIALIRNAIPDEAPNWADLGAGSGTFTRALASVVGAAGTVHAIERDPVARRALARLAQTHEVRGGASIVVVAGDFTQPLPCNALHGILMANALHFVQHAEQPAVLRRIATHLGLSGRIVLVEYDRARGSPWVPFPIPERSLNSLAAAAGLSKPAVTGRMPSAFGGDIYCAWSARA